MPNRKRIAVVLSGCGVYDGSEIHEATMSLLAVVRNGAEYEVFAPDVKQTHVINHVNGQVTREERNVLLESARIARGKIRPLSAFKAEEFDGLLFPGGFGAAKNLSTYAFDGPEMKVNGDVEKAIHSMVKLNKPVGALCIAPVILARILGRVEITIGDDDSTAEHLRKMGAVHKKTGFGEVVVDKNHKIVTSAAYMLDANIAQVAEGADNTVKAMLKLME